MSSSFELSLSSYATTSCKLGTSGSKALVVIKLFRLEESIGSFHYVYAYFIVI